MKKATLADVANLAGVSLGTVSKYINGITVLPKNAEKIQSVIDSIGYTPNTIARSFKSGRTMTVLLMIITEAPVATTTWLHELPIILGLTEALKSRDYSLKIEIVNKEQVDVTAAHLETYAKSHSVDGIVLLTSWDVPSKLVAPLDYFEFPYIVVGSRSNGPGFGYIDFDNSSPICTLLHELYDHGCRHFALAGGFQDQRHMFYRTKGFVRGLKEIGIDVDSVPMLYGDYSLESGFQLGMEILRREPRADAIICGNDTIAAGVIRAAAELKIEIPTELKITGFDNSVVSEASVPTITSVSVPSMEMGLNAGTELIKRMQDQNYVIKNQLLACNIIYKKSTEASC